MSANLVYVISKRVILLVFVLLINLCDGQVAFPSVRLDVGDTILTNDGSLFGSIE